MIDRCPCHSSDHWLSLVYPKNKLLHGLWVRLDNLLEERSDIFEETHKWLFDPSLKPEITVSLRERQNEIEIEKVKKAINFEEFLIEEKRKKAIPPPVQGVLPIDNPTNIV